MEAEKVALGGAAKAHTRTVTARENKALSGSQFMDAPDEQVRAHIADALSSQADHIVRHCVKQLLIGQSPIRPTLPSSRSTRFRDNGSPVRRIYNANAPPIGKKSIHRASRKSALPPRFLEELRYAQLSRSVSEPVMSYTEDETESEPDFRQSGATQRTNGTGYTSGASVELRTPTRRKRDSGLRAELLNRTRSMRIINPDDSEEESQESAGLDTLDELDEIKTPVV